MSFGLIYFLLFNGKFRNEGIGYNLLAHGLLKFTASNITCYLDIGGKLINFPALLIFFEIGYTRAHITCNRNINCDCRDIALKSII